MIGENLAISTTILHPPLRRSKCRFDANVVGWLRAANGELALDLNFTRYDVHQLTTDQPSGKIRKGITHIRIRTIGLAGEGPINLAVREFFIEPSARQRLDE